MSTEGLARGPGREEELAEQEKGREASVPGRGTSTSRSGGVASGQIPGGLWLWARSLGGCGL